MMDESRYNGLIASTFKKLLAALDGVDPDVLDADSTGDMVTISSSSGEKCVVNTQRAVRQVWVAGRSQGIHFDYDEGSKTWKDDKHKGLELFAFVADVLKQMSGVTLSF
ncbi:MAG: iron donor protein CyaY [Myxococcaceae bacterium]